jgi:hypothetical protein
MLYTDGELAAGEFATEVEYSLHLTGNVAATTLLLARSETNE